jgi:uncharacterized membrane protein YqaE (UPF0057 family)
MAALWDLILIIIAFFIPPLAAFFKKGLHHEFWISLLLTILGWLPGVLYTWWIILSRHHRNYHYWRPRQYGGSTANPLSARSTITTTPVV